MTFQTRVICGITYLWPDHAGTSRPMADASRAEAVLRSLDENKRMFDPVLLSFEVDRTS